jgi:hypothetical protein
MDSLQKRIISDTLISFIQGPIPKEGHLNGLSASLDNRLDAVIELGKLTKHYYIGVWDGIKGSAVDTLETLKYIAQHPIKTAEAVADLAMNLALFQLTKDPKYLLPIAIPIGNEIMDQVERWNNGDRYERAEQIGEFVGRGFVGISSIGVVIKQIKIMSVLVNATGKFNIKLKGNYPEEYVQNLLATYQIFREAGVDITEHGLNRVLGRASRGVTPENTIDAFVYGKTYFDPEYGTMIRFKDGIAVSYDKDTLQIVNVQTQKKPTARWVEQ